MFLVGLALHDVFSGEISKEPMFAVLFVLGWAVGVVVSRPWRFNALEVLQRGLLICATEWGLGIPFALLVVLNRSSELEVVGSANMIGYATGALIVGGGISLAGAGLFLGFWFFARKAGKRLSVGGGSVAANSTETPDTRLTPHSSGPESAAAAASVR